MPVVIRQPIRSNSHAHDDLFERRVASALADTVDRALHLTDARVTAACVLPPPARESSWQWALNTALSEFGTFA
jgi:hypothetical protein